MRTVSSNFQAQERMTDSHIRNPDYSMPPEANTWQQTCSGVQYFCKKLLLFRFRAHPFQSSLAHTFQGVENTSTMGYCLTVASHFKALHMENKLFLIECIKDEIFARIQALESIRFSLKKICTPAYTQ